MNKLFTYTPPKHHLYIKLSALSLTLFLYGCGGGGGGSSTVLPTKAIDYSYDVAPYSAGAAGITITRDNSPSPVEPSNNPTLPTSTAGNHSQQQITNAETFWNDTEGSQGEGISIGFVDSGANPNHIDFYDDSGDTRILWNQARGFLVTDNLGFEIENNNDYVDIDSSEYHGTHITSIAAGREYGIAPKASIIPINVFFDEESAYNTAIHSAVDYLAKNAPVINASITQMVNLSVEGVQNSEFNAYLTTLKNNDSVLVTAAGNQNIPIGVEHFDDFNSARNLSIISDIENQVLHAIALETNANSSGEYEIASFSNYPGDCSDVAFNADRVCSDEVMSSIQNNFISAPGVFIRAADGSDDSSTISYSGTSMATPVVSGGLALLLSAWDNLTPQQAVQILKESANDSGIYSNSRLYGVGLMDMQAAAAPLGELKSNASSSTKSTANTSDTANISVSHSLSDANGRVSSELAGLAKLPALTKVAYFDKYNRDYAINLTKAIQIEAQAIEWNQYWNTQKSNNQRFSLDKFTVNIDVTPNQNSMVSKLSIQDEDGFLNYQGNSSASFAHNAFLPKHFFIEPNASQFGHSLTAAQRLFDGASLFVSYQDRADNNELSFLNNNRSGVSSQITNNDFSTSPKSYALGFNVDLNNHWSFLSSSKITEQTNGFGSTYGQGALSFGEQSSKHSHLHALTYQRNKTQLYGQIMHGHLLDIESQAGSYIDIEKARFAQFKLGLIQQISSQETWGMETYNQNTLMDTSIKLTLPDGINKNGLVTTQTKRFNLKNNLSPDSLQFFYRSKLTNKLNLQFNYLASPDDRGLGLFANRVF